MKPLAALIVMALAGTLQPGDVQTLRSLTSLPAHIAGAFDDISSCHLTAGGDYLVFDRRAHAVFTVARGADVPTKIVQVGGEPGRILRPTAFDSAPTGMMVVADSPGPVQRVQFFLDTGASLGGFTMNPSPVLQILAGELVLGGIASLEFNGRSIVLNQPETGALITEYGINGRPLRNFGELRPTGHERDRDLHAALNVGVPIAIPQGGFYFVFAGGVPMFRKYDAAGALVFERHIEGVELDQHIRSLPTTWPPRASAGAGEFPLVSASVRAAGVDPAGNLWVSLIVPYTYVYDGRGEKRRTIQFKAAGTLAPSSFFFTGDGRVLTSPGCFMFRP